MGKTPTPKVPRQPGPPRVGPLPVATGGRGFPPGPPKIAAGLSDEAFRDHAIIAIYAAKLAVGGWPGMPLIDYAIKEADTFLNDLKYRRDERKKGGA